MICAWYSDVPHHVRHGVEEVSRGVGRHEECREGALFPLRFVDDGDDVGAVGNVGVGDQGLLAV